MLRGALVGFGNVAQLGHWPGYAASRDAKIVAVVDPSAERRAAAEKLPLALGVFPSLTDIDREAIDFVDICTPPSQHAEPMQEAIARGWHVLCEKPLLLAPSLMAEAREEAIARNVAVVPLHNWRYAPILAAATARLQSGAIGTLQRVEIITRRMAAADAADKSDWRRNPEIAGGGILMDHGWHSLYLTLGWFGRMPEKLQSRLHRPNDQSAESEAVLDLDFGEGKARIDLSWDANERSNEMKLIGDAGEILVLDDQLVVNGESTRFASALSAGSHHPDWFEAMLPDVLASFRDPALARPKFEEAAHCLEILRHAYASAVTP
ncbi:MAG: Gfo/Idh/MocA family protein [Chthoniobacterales bacterium]